MRATLGMTLLGSTPAHTAQAVGADDARAGPVVAESPLPVDAAPLAAAGGGGAEHGWQGRRPGGGAGIRRGPLVGKGAAAPAAPEGRVTERRRPPGELSAPAARGREREAHPPRQIAERRRRAGAREVAGA